MEKNPIKTKRVSAGTRIYYLDAFKDSKGSPYLSISEIPTDKSPGNKKRQRIFVHAQNLETFANALNEMVAELSNDTSR